MPAKSQAQRGYLNMKFGHAWVKEHHFDNKGKLPYHVGDKMRAAKGKSKGKSKRMKKPKGMHQNCRAC